MIGKCFASNTIHSTNLIGLKCYFFGCPIASLVVNAGLSNGQLGLLFDSSSQC